MTLGSPSLQPRAALDTGRPHRWRRDTLVAARRVGSVLSLTMCHCSMVYPKISIESYAILTLLPNVYVILWGYRVHVIENRIMHMIHVFYLLKNTYVF